MSALTLTQAALDRIAILLQKRDKPSVGIRIGIKTKGCSGLAYALEYADGVGKDDEVVYDGDFCVMVTNQALMYILGTEMDFIEEPMKSGFVFNNPNKKGSCGCGKSFHV